MRTIDHPTTSKLIETIEAKNKLYIVMELVKGGELYDYIYKKKFLEGIVFFIKIKTLSFSIEYEASYIMKQLLISLSYLHNMSIIHRDLKPENIMITQIQDNKIKIKLIDFGFARFISPNGTLSDAVGTAYYLGKF